MPHEHINNSHLSLFSGIGGLDLAAEWAGFRTVALVERDKYCQRVLARHWPGVPIYGDIREFSWRGERPLIMSGGFPCQPFSSAGKRNGKSHDSYLWPEMFRVVEEARPAWVIGENVAGIDSLALEQVLSDLETIGYNVTTLEIPACAVDADHIRFRTWILGYSDANGESGVPIYEKKTQGLPICDCGSGELGTAYGIPGGVDRLGIKALGNAVVPQQAYPIFKAIAEIEGIHV